MICWSETGETISSMVVWEVTRYAGLQAMTGSKVDGNRT